MPSGKGFSQEPRRAIAPIWRGAGAVSTRLTGFRPGRTNVGPGSERTAMPMTSPQRAPGRRTGKTGASPARAGGGLALGAEHGLSNQLLQRRPVARARAPEEGGADRIADHALRGAPPPAPSRRVAPREGASLFRSRGRPLDRAARARFGPHFPGLDEVRIHDDAEGARAATALGARAFTAGRDIAFGAGRYAPGTSEGDRLLAHELAHVA